LGRPGWGDGEGVPGCKTRRRAWTKWGGVSARCIGRHAMIWVILGSESEREVNDTTSDGRCMKLGESEGRSVNRE